MPRPKKANGAEPKKRSRTGCWPCKTRKVKCGEEKPECSNCVKQGDKCDYSIRLQWGGRSKKEQDAFSSIDTPGTFSFQASPQIYSPIPTPSAAASRSAPASDAPAVSEQPRNGNGNGNGNNASTPARDSPTAMLDPQLAAMANGPYHAAAASNVYNLPMPPPSLHRTASFGSAFPSSAQYAYASNQLPPPVASPGSGPYGTAAPISDYNAPSSPHAAYDFSWSRQHRSKRARLDSSATSSPQLPHPRAGPGINGLLHHNPPLSNLYASHSIDSAAATPLTPDSSVASDDSRVPQPRSIPPAAAALHPPPSRRLSVHSLLSGPPGDYESPTMRTSVRLYRVEDDDGCFIYGYDRGYSDLDVLKNNDAIAIAHYSSPDASTLSESSSPQANSPALIKDSVCQPGGYYAQPVAIKIDREFEPLPEYLINSPMNLLYFHHFLNHTARILVPHDCPDNPLKTTLPRMAMQYPNLLNLLLAYSASHRARLLGHPEPKQRIALWLSDVFPDLRHALGSGERITDATLATAIMLASREIITPNTFEVNIPWQNHLGIARQMIISRGGLKDMGASGDQTVSFLARWFAYLDVIGSLSGYKNELPLAETYWNSRANVGGDETTEARDVRVPLAEDDSDDEHGFTIDCFFGFTNCCISLLARVSKLAHHCDRQRIDDEGNVNADWQPDPGMVTEARALEAALVEAKHHPFRGCKHSRYLGTADEGANGRQDAEAYKLDREEIGSTNEAFHLAGLIYLYRRVLGKPSEDAGVQKCVREVLQALARVRKGSTAESCLLFPMFSAGCEAVEQEHREGILARLKLVEAAGLTHVQRARLLMEKSWETGRPWETLVSGEFFG